MKSHSLNFITSAIVLDLPPSMAQQRSSMTVLFLMYQWVELVGSSSVLQTIICSSNHPFPFYIRTRANQHRPQVSVKVRTVVSVNLL